MKLKVCGIKYHSNALALASHVDYMGFIFYEASPRCVKQTDYLWIKSLRPALKIGVFVNPTQTEVADHHQACSLDIIQLHGDESPALCQEIRVFSKVIKAIPIACEADFEACEKFKHVVDYFLFDTKGTLHGGNGYAFDWTLLSRYESDVPFFLSGGITPGMSREILTLCHDRLKVIDVNSGFETEPGMKSTGKLLTFKNELNGSFKQL